jgi:hypothetical protein
MIGTDEAAFNGATCQHHQAEEHRNGSSAAIIALRGNCPTIADISRKSKPIAIDVARGFLHERLSYACRHPKPFTNRSLRNSPGYSKADIDNGRATNAPRARRVVASRSDHTVP